MNHINIISLIKNAKTLSVNMVKNTIVLDGVEYKADNLQFNCNWNEQEIIDIVDHHVFNAECDQIKMKTETGSVNLPIKEAILIKTNQYEKISIGWYRTDNI